MTETSAEIRQNPNAALWCCVESNCMGRIFAANNPYEEPAFCSGGENVWKLDDAGSVVHVTDKEEANAIIKARYSELGTRQRKHVTGK